MSLRWTSRAGLEKRISKSTLRAICDDDENGTTDEEIIQDILTSSEAEVLSYLPPHYNLDELPHEDPVLASAAYDFAVALAFERHPEYVRSHGEESRSKRWDRAEKKMLRIQAGIQQPPAVVEIQKPKTIGGIVEAPGPGMFVSSDGGCNGDF